MTQTIGPLSYWVNRIVDSSQISNRCPPSG